MPGCPVPTVVAGQASPDALPVVSPVESPPARRNIGHPIPPTSDLEVAMIRFHSIPVAALAAAALLSACVDSPASLYEAQPVALDNSPMPPPGLVSAGFGPQSLQLWPFTGTDLAGSDADPMNLLFVGNVDVLSLRAALIALDGNRTAFGFPAGPPFDCRWTDAFGDVQTAYSRSEGWVANPIQLACGDYSPVRFHIRLFPAGNWVMAGTHFDLHIAGTADHRVISWELPEQLVVADFIRAGILDPVMPLSVAAINPSPSYRTIESAIFNAMPDPLKVAAGLPTGTSALPVPVPSNGIAEILNVAARTPLDAGTTSQAFDITYGQFIPRPLCSTGPLDYLYVEGPVHFEQRVMTNGHGTLESWQMARGDLMATPVNPLTGQPTGPTFRAQTEDLHIGVVTPGAFNVEVMIRRQAFPPAGDHGQSSTTHLNVGSQQAKFWINERC